MIGTIEEDGFDSNRWINFEEKKLEKGRKETGKGRLALGVGGKLPVTAWCLEHLVPSPSLKSSEI